MTLRGQSDLGTVIEANIDMTNVTGLTNKPQIITEGGVEFGSGDQASGILELKDEIFDEEKINFSFKHKFYTITATFCYTGSAETPMKEILEEIERVLDVQSSTSNNEYKMSYTWDSNIIVSVVPIVFDIIYKFQAVTTS